MVTVPLNAAGERLRMGLLRLDLKALQWFMGRVDTTFAMKTGALRADFKHNFDAPSTPETLHLRIHSNLPYAIHVERMTGVNWTFTGTVEHAAMEATNEFHRLIHAWIREAFRP